MSKLSKIFLALFLIGILTGCQSQTPKPDDALNGKWAIELNSNDIGVVRSVMSFEVKDSTFIGYTRSGADRDILGFWKSMLGRIFTSDFKHGALINITEGKVKHHGDTVLLSAIFRSAFASYYFKGKVCNDRLEAALLNGNKELSGSIKGNRKLPVLPLGNYPALMNEITETTQKNIYNKSVLSKQEWRDFAEKMKELSGKVQDDIEMELAFFYYAGKLPFSHYSLIRPGVDKTKETNTMASAEKQVVLTEKSPEIVYMRIKTFSGTAVEMDSAFSTIIRKGYKNLIVDLCDNPGGSVEAGMSFATHVADTTFYGGVFLTQKWFEKHDAPPGAKDYTKLPAFTEKNYDLIIDGIHKEEGLCLKIIPENKIYKGKLFILTNGNTASTCEPIVYGLKQNGRAVVVGEKTAGVMLNGERFGISDGFSLILPTADYYAADGYRIDRQGVVPNIAVEQAKALDNVMARIVKK